MKKFLIGIIVAVALLLALPFLAHAQTNTTQGGTGLSTYTAGDLIFYNSGLKFNKLPIGANGKCLIVSGLLPSWQTCPDNDTGVVFSINGGYASSGDVHDLTLNKIDLTDSNHVTGSWTGSDQGFTYWNGSNLQKMPTDTFFTDGTNIYINHDFWFEKNPSSGAYRFDVTPVAAGEVITGVINDLFSGASGTAGFLFSESGIASGNCLEGGATPYLIVDSGAPCGTGGGLSDGDYGDITVGGSGTTLTIDNDAVTYAKMQNVSATNRLLGRSTAGSGDVEEITVGGDISQSGSTFTIGSNAVALSADTTGNYVSSATASGGLTMSGTEGASLGVLLPSATNGLSTTTSSGSGLELVSAGLTMLQGCADTEILKWNETTDVWACAADANSGGSTAWNDIGDATADGTIVLGGNETDFTSTLDSAGKAVWTITNTDADTAADTDFLDLYHNDGADSNIFYLRAVGDADGTPQTDYRFGQTGALIRPDLTVTGGVIASLFEGLRANHAFDFINNTESASVQTGMMRGQRATGTDNDEAYISYLLSNGSGTSTEMARETWKATDADSGTGIDAQIEWDIKVANSLVNEMILSGTGLDLAASDGLSFGGVSIISDSAGTTTLSNVDAIDSTTETTLEAAIDIAGDVTGTGLGSVVVAANAVALSTDTTGNYVSSATASGGLTMTGTEGASLGILLPAATDALSANTSSGSGLELLSSGLTLLQGCSDGQILKWTEATDLWGCAADGGGGGSFDSTTVDSTTWSDNANASNTWTFDVSGTDTTWTMGNNNWIFGTGSVDLGSAGVRLSQDGDGAITFLGLGNGSDEDLTLNLDDTSNTGVFSSSTSLATLNFSGISLQSSGVAIPTISSTDSLSNKTIPASSNVLDACIPVAVTDEYSDLTTGTAKTSFRMPFAMTVTSIRGSVVTNATGGTLLTVDINEAGTTILSTKLTFDASELTTTTAATAAVVSDSSLADDALITVDIDAVGSTLPGNGLKISICGTI